MQWLLTVCGKQDHGLSWGQLTVLFDANVSWPASEFHSEHSNAIWDPTRALPPPLPTPTCYALLTPPPHASCV